MWKYLRQARERARAAVQLQVRQVEQRVGLRVAARQHGQVREAARQRAHQLPQQAQVLLRRRDFDLRFI